MIRFPQERSPPTFMSHIVSDRFRSLQSVAFYYSGKEVSRVDGRGPAKTRGNLPRV
jgi:hypothetical protein